MTTDEAIRTLKEHKITFQHDFGWNTSTLEAIDIAIKALEQEPKWIPVSERLPKPYQNILVTSEDFHWANEPVSYSVKQKCFGGIVDFIAWMPLPKPYKPTDSESEDNDADSN